MSCGLGYARACPEGCPWLVHPHPGFPMLRFRFLAAMPRPRPRFVRHLAACIVASTALPWAAQAQETTAVNPPAASVPLVNDLESPFAFHGQTTYIWQRKPSFGAAYSGENSLTPNRAKSYSFTATFDLGLRLWKGAEFHLNPEVAQGVPFSELHGMGGLSNGELAKTASTSPKAMPTARLVKVTRTASSLSSAPQARATKAVVPADTAIMTACSVKNI